MPDKNTNAGIGSVDENGRLNVENPTNVDPTDNQDQNIPSQGPVSDEVLYLLQQAKEEAKFEIKQELAEAINSEYQKFAEIDPTLATALKAVAAAINGSISNVVPIGENSQLNAIKEQQAQSNAQNLIQNVQQKKQASISLPEFVWDKTMEKVASMGYFEQNETADETIIRNDLDELFQTIVKGMDKFAELNEVDLTDANYWAVLEDYIKDGTFFNMGLEND